MKTQGQDWPMGKRGSDLQTIINHLAALGGEVADIGAVYWYEAGYTPGRTGRIILSRPGQTQEGARKTCEQQHKTWGGDQPLKWNAWPEGETYGLDAEQARTEQGEIYTAAPKWVQVSEKGRPMPLHELLERYKQEGGDEHNLMYLFLYVAGRAGEPCGEALFASREAAQGWGEKELGGKMTWAEQVSHYGEVRAVNSLGVHPNGKQFQVLERAFKLRDGVAPPKWR